MDWFRSRTRKSNGAPPTKPSQSPKRWSASRVRFVSEQDGSPERELKQALHAVLVSRPRVARAYLARVDYGDPVPHEVALCISGPSDEGLVNDVSSTFARQFGRATHLDIMFLSSTQELELQQVCRPFYEAG